MREVGGLSNSRGKSYSYGVRVGQLSLYSQVLLLPLGVPPMLAPAPHKVLPKTMKFGGCSPPLIREMS